MGVRVRVDTVEQKDSDLTHLCLTLRRGELVKIGDSYVKIRDVGTSEVMIQINAPRSVLVLRERTLKKNVG